MNNKLLNTQIEALTREHGAEIVKFYGDNGFYVDDYGGTSCKENRNHYIFYGVDSYGNFDNRKFQDSSPIKTITLEEAKALVEKPYPKLMYVWDDDENSALKRVVLGKFDKWYLAISSDKKEDISLKQRPTVWDNAKDIKEQPIIELTLEEIAAKFGHKSSQIRIKE